MPAETDIDQMQIRCRNQFHGFESLQDMSVVGAFLLGAVAAATGLTFSNGIKILTGAGTPEAAVVAPIGSIFLRTNGGAATSLYVKETGAGNTGWVGK